MKFQIRDSFKKFVKKSIASVMLSQKMAIIRI